MEKQKGKAAAEIKRVCGICSNPMEERSFRLEQITVGHIVQYVLSSLDTEQINRGRMELVGHAPARAGNIAPAIVIWPHHNEDSTFNGLALLDSNDVLWLTSVRYDAAGSQGTWHWPQLVQ